MAHHQWEYLVSKIVVERHARITPTGGFIEINETIALVFVGYNIFRFEGIVARAAILPGIISIFIFVNFSSLTPAHQLHFTRHIALVETAPLGVE